MNTLIRPFGRRGFAATAALAVGLVGFGSQAFAADGDIDFSKTGSLTIHKHETGSQTASGTPDGKTDTGGEPVKDVVFTAFPIANLDLKQQASWDGLATLNVPANACGDDFNTPSLTLPSGTAATFDAGIVFPATDVAGMSTKAGLMAQAYLVCETTAPASVKKKAAPFFVTIPFPDNGESVDSDGDGNGANDTESNTKGWLYDINVYPKNTVVIAPIKEIEVDGKKHSIKADEQLTFPVTAKIPSIGKEDAFKYFVISDPFDANLQNGKVAKVTIDGVDAEDSYIVKTDGQTASVGFTKEGLEFLKTKPNKNVIVTFTADVKGVPATGGIENTANLYVDTIPGTPGNPPSTPPNTPPSTPPNDDPGTPTNKVVSSWGNLKIAKRDVDNQQPLTGAAFKVYNATEATAYGADCSSAVKDGDAIAIDGKTEFTTGADGSVNLEGLFVDKKQFDADAQGPFAPEHSQRCYVIEEIAAPSGYVLPSGDNALKGVAVKAGVSTDIDISVDNTKQNVPQLPITGASGQLFMTIGGVSLILLAVGATLVARRRREDA